MNYLDKIMKQYKVPKGYCHSDGHRVPAYLGISADELKGLSLIQELMNMHTRQVIEGCEAKCAANILPKGYVYGPIQLKFQDPDPDYPHRNLVKVTAYREVYKLKPGYDAHQSE